MTRMRFRADDWGIADYKTYPKNAGDRPDFWSDEDWATPVAEPGDTWRSTWWKEQTNEGPPAGYLICCTNCKHVHGWSTANNCSSKRIVTADDGTTYPTCDHMGVGSCWTWTGSAEDGTLTASPSLHCPTALGGCGFHGWLRNGVLTDA